MRHNSYLSQGRTLQNVRIPEGHFGTVSSHRRMMTPESRYNVPSVKINFQFSESYFSLLPPPPPVAPNFPEGSVKVIFKFVSCVSCPTGQWTVEIAYLDNSVNQRFAVFFSFRLISWDFRVMLKTWNGWWFLFFCFYYKL